MATRTILITPLALFLGACSTSSTVEQRPSVDLAIADFSDPGATVARPEPVSDETTSPRTVQPPLDTVVGTPEPSADAQPTGERLVVDRVVGQINGKPVYAEEFYRESAAYWREYSLRTPLRQWTEEIARDTNQRLLTLVREELLLAEFRANLTPAQKQGVLAFVQNLRDQAISLRGGSEQEANRKALEEFGVDLDTAIKNQAEREIILQQLRETIVKRVQVSTRDVELYYQRNIDKYRPQPVATLRKVRADQSDTEARERIEAAIASGTFPEEGSSTDVVELDAGGKASTQFYGPAPLNDAAKTLALGEIAGPIQVGTGVWWITLDSLEEQPQRSLYDVQLDIEQLIRDQRLREEEARYFERLLQRSNVSALQDMVINLLDYAADRLYIPEDER